MDVLTVAHPTDADVRDRQPLDAEGLLREALEAVDASGVSQRDMAKRLGVSQVAISKALGGPAGRFTDLQRRIVAELTPYTIEDETTPAFRVHRKGT